MPSGQPDDDLTRSYSVIPEGTQVSHYRIVRRIGLGGMGEVYLAEDIELRRKVALKFLSHELTTVESARTRFKRESQSAAALSHPNIVTIYEVGEYNKRPFFAMEYLEGLSLREVIDEGDMSIDGFFTVAIQICEGLREAHEAGIVHRDVKPSNFVLDKKGRCAILDFGLATVLDDRRLTRNSSTFGTIGYMSPEQVRGEKLDRRSDIFSAGAVFYEMLTGRQPFQRETDAATLHAIVTAKPEPIARYKSGSPPELQRIVDKTIEKDRELRYQHADDVLADLKRMRHAATDRTADFKGPSIGAPPRPVPRYIKFGGAALIALLTIALLYPISRRTIEKLVGLRAVPEDKHLVILPFANLGGTAVSQAFCDGLMETMSSKVTQLEKYHGSLWVVPASEVRSENITSPRTARRAFGATLAVTGSVQRLGDKIRMTLTLVNTETERNIRSTVIDDSVSNLYALQDSILISVAEMLELHLRPEQRQVLAEDGTVSPKAYEYYVEAKGHLQHFESRTNVEMAVAAFENATNEDADFALAYAGLAEAHWHNYDIFGNSESERLALHYSQFAVKLNGDLAPVRMTLGVIHKRTGRYDDAVREFREALRLDPASREAYRELATVYEARNELELAERAYKKAIELKPDFWTGYSELGLFYVYHGRHEDADRLLRAAVRLDPKGFVAWNNLGAIYYYSNRIDDARRMWERSFEIESNYAACSNLGSLYYLQDRYSEAALMYEKALEISDHSYEVWGNLASAYEWIPGRHNDALKAYERAIAIAEEKQEVNPRDPEVLSALAEYYATTGRREKAIWSVNELLCLEPENANFMVTVGFVYEVVGDRDEALKWIGRALELGYPRSEIESLPEFRTLIEDQRFVKLPGADQNVSNDDSVAAE